MTVISFEEVLKSIEELNQKQPDGFSVSEMAKILGKSQQWCRAQIGKMIRAKKVKFVGEKTITRIDGRGGRTPVYRLID